MSIRHGGQQLTASPDRLNLQIRRLGVEDLDRMYAIEEMAYPFPWSRGIFVECLRVGYACFGLQLGTDLVGYAIYNWAAAEAHLLNLCIHPEWQHQGYGDLLLEYVINHVSRLENNVLFLEVRESNPRAKLLYQRKGFAVVSRRPSYYNAGEGHEDAIGMCREL